MRKLVLFSLLLSLLFIASLGLLVVANRRQPTGPTLENLHLTDCELPCWIGIVPGQTTIDVARERINALFGQSNALDAEVRVSTSSAEMPRWRVGVSSDKVVIRLNALDGSTVDNVEFSFNGGQFTVADLFTLMGSPSRMARWHQNFPYYVMAYGTNERGLIAFSDLSEAFRWTQPVKVIVLYAHGQLPVPPEDLFPWFGFHNIHDYYERMP